MSASIITYIGGGSKAWAKKFMSDLLLQEEVSGVLRLYDIDEEAARRNKAWFDKLMEKSEIKSNWNCKVYGDIDKALEGADFVVISILPGTFDEMEVDVHHPERYGIYQSVGDTVGPGGFNRGLRTIPIFRELASKIRKNCPTAWVINYTNPMTFCVASLYKEFPQIRAFGCCHEVFNTQKLLMEMYLLSTGDPIDMDRHGIEVNVQGINHFTWLSEAKYKGIDLYPLFREFVKNHWEKGYMNEKYRRDAHTFNRYFTYNEKVKFDLFRRFGVIAAAGDRHLAEFLPTSYLNSPEEVEKMGFYITPVSWRKEDEKRKIQRTIDQIEGREECTLEASDEEGVDQIRALLGYHVLITNVNLPNDGQLPDLPIGAVVETNAIFSGNSVRPVFAGEMDPNIRTLVLEHALNQQNFIEAYFQGEKQKLFESFYNDPAVRKLKRDDAKNLFHELIEGTRLHLEEWVVHGKVV